MLLDTSAWIEYFRGTEKGKRVELLLQEPGGNIVVCPLTLAEVSVWSNRIQEDPHHRIEAIKAFADIVPLTEQALISSGTFYHHIRNIKEKISLIDCIIYTTTRIHQQTLLTADTDFAGLPGVELL